MSSFYDLMLAQSMSGGGGGTARLQSKTATPTEEFQSIKPDSGYDGLSKVTVNPIPSNYGLITWNGSTLTVS